MAQRLVAYIKRFQLPPKICQHKSPPAHPLCQDIVLISTVYSERYWWGRAFAHDTGSSDCNKRLMMTTMSWCMPGRSWAPSCLITSHCTHVTGAQLSCTSDVERPCIDSHLVLVIPPAIWVLHDKLWKNRSVGVCAVLLSWHWIHAQRLRKLKINVKY